MDQLSNGRVEVGIGRGIYGREAVNMNKEADLKDQAKNFRLFEESLTIMKKAWTEEFFSHQGEFYTYPSPNFTWQHDMSCLLYTSPSPRDATLSRMPSSA